MARPLPTAEERVEFRKKDCKVGGSGFSVEFSNGLCADMAGCGELVSGDSLSNARDEDELEPLGERHLVEAERAGELELVGPKWRFLPEADGVHLGLNFVQFGGNACRKL